jgi:hypothetical protein
MRRSILTITACVAWAAIAACGGAPGGTSPDADVASVVDRVKGGMESQAAAGQAFSAQSATVAAARDEAAKALGVPPEQATIEKVEPVQWNDASLGCAEPGKTAAQVITPGLRIVIAAAGQRREVHADSAGRMVVCQNPSQ